MQSKAATVEQYLAELPPGRRAAISAVRNVILKNLDKDYEECMGYGMMGYVVPHSIYPPGYHCNPKTPLPFAGLASQKNYMSLYMMGLYCGCVEGTQDTALIRWFHDAWKKSGKKIDMGKCCIRFRKLEDLPLEIIGEAIRRQPVKVYLAAYQNALRAMGKGPDGKPLKDAGAKGAMSPRAAKPGAKKSPGKKVVKKKAVHRNR